MRTIACGLRHILSNNAETHTCIFTRPLVGYRMPTRVHREAGGSIFR